MADNVEIKFGADASKMNREFEKMRDKISSLTNTVDKLKDKSREGGRVGKDAFKGMGDEMSSFINRAVGVTAIYAGILKSITAVIEKTKELRALRDESAISSSAALNRVNKEYGLEGTDQDKMTAVIQGISQSRRMKISRVADLAASAGNEGFKKEDIYSGKLNSVVDLMNVNENLTGEQAINLVQTGLRKLGKSSKDYEKSDIDKISKYYATMGRDLLGSDIEFGSLDKDIGFKESIVLMDMAKKDRYGKGRKSAVDINEGYKKSGYGGAIKAAGFKDRAEYEQALSQLDIDATDMLAKQSRIQRSSREAELAYSENAEEIAFSNSKKGKPLEKALNKLRKAGEELNDKDYLDRVLADTGASIVGEEQEKTMRDARDNGEYFTATRFAFDFYKKIFTDGEEKIDQQNKMRAKDFGSKKIDKTDTKDFR